MIRALDRAAVGSTRTSSGVVRNLHLYEPLGWERVDRQPVHLVRSGWIEAFTYVKRRQAAPSAVVQLVTDVDRKTRPNRT